MEKTIIAQLKEFLTQKIEKLKKASDSENFGKADSQEGRFYSAYSSEAIKLAMESFQSVLVEIERLEKENPSMEDTLNGAFESFAKKAENIQEDFVKTAKEGYQTFHASLSKLATEVLSATKID